MLVTERRAASTSPGRDMTTLDSRTAATEAAGGVLPHGPGTLDQPERAPPTWRAIASPESDRGNTGGHQQRTAQPAAVNTLVQEGGGEQRRDHHTGLAHRRDGRGAGEP